MFANHAVGNPGSGILCDWLRAGIRTGTHSGTLGASLKNRLKHMLSRDTGVTSYSHAYATAHLAAVVRTHWVPWCLVDPCHRRAGHLSYVLADALYMMALTGTTIGFGGFVPFNAAQRGFCVSLCTLGGGLVAHCLLVASLTPSVDHIKQAFGFLEHDGKCAKAALYGRDPGYELVPA